MLIDQRLRELIEIDEMQSGFRKRKGTIYAIHFSLRSYDKVC